MKSICLIVTLLVGCACVFAQSQANTGNIEGVVTDQTDRAVANAEVTITNEGTNFTRVLTTDNEGRFRGLLLPLGNYKVTVKAGSFATLVRTGLDLKVGQTITLVLLMSVSSVQQEISVSAEAPIIETGKVETSTYLDQHSVQDLPNNGRNF